MFFKEGTVGLGIPDGQGFGTLECETAANGRLTVFLKL